MDVFTVIPGEAKPRPGIQLFFAETSGGIPARACGLARMTPYRSV
jgi:hypothetical protein